MTATEPPGDDLPIDEEDLEGDTYCPNPNPANISSSSVVALVLAPVLLPSIEPASGIICCNDLQETNRLKMYNG